MDEKLAENFASLLVGIDIDIPPSLQRKKAILPSYQVKHFYVWLLQVHIKKYDIK